MMKKPIVNTAVQIIGKFLGVFISLLTTGILTRRLGVGTYGNFVLISSLFVFLDSLADFGTKTIGVREISANNNRRGIGQIFNLRLIMAMSAFLVGMCLVWSYEGVREFRVEASIALLMVFLTSMAGYFEIVFQTRLRMDLKVVVDIVFPVAFLFWLISWKGNINLALIFGAYIIARTISLVIGYFLASGLEKLVWEKPKWKEIKELWILTWPMGVFLMLFATYDRAVDSWLINNFLGAKEVAWYGLAYKIYGVMIQPAYFYVNSVFPMMSSKEVDRRKLFWLSSGIMIAGALTVVTIVQILAPFMVNVLAGADFEPSVQILRLLITAAVFSYFGHLVGFALIARGGQNNMLKIGIAALMFNLVLNIILIPRFGVMAAAVVTVATEFLDMMLMIYYLRKTRN